MEITKFREDILSDILSGVDSKIVWEKLKDYKEQGMDKETMYNILDSLRLEMRQKGDEKTEDAIMEYMDLVVGWCNPKWKIFP